MPNSLLSVHYSMRDHKSLHAWQEARGVVLGSLISRALLGSRTQLPFSPNSNGPHCRFSLTSLKAMRMAHPEIVPGT